MSRHTLDIVYCACLIHIYYKNTLKAKLWLLRGAILEFWKGWELWVNSKSLLRVHPPLISDAEAYIYESLPFLWIPKSSVYYTLKYRRCCSFISFPTRWGASPSMEPLKKLQITTKGKPGECQWDKSRGTPRGFRDGKRESWKKRGEMGARARGGEMGRRGRDGERRDGE